MTLTDNGINTKGKTEGQFKTTCPKCSEKRRPLFISKYR